MTSKSGKSKPDCLRPAACLLIKDASKTNEELCLYIPIITRLVVMVIAEIKYACQEQSTYMVVDAASTNLHI